MANRETKAKEYLRYWQILLGLQAWQLQVEFKKFTRADYPQSGDIEVDGENKTATVFLSQQETGRDRAIILHELIHLILWQLDHWAEETVPDEKKDTYFELLEKVVADLSRIINEKDH